MLKGLDSRLNSDVLYVLRAMGDGDTLALNRYKLSSRRIGAQIIIWAAFAD